MQERILQPMTDDDVQRRAKFEEEQRAKLSKLLGEAEPRSTPTNRKQRREAMRADRKRGDAQKARA